MDPERTGRRPTRLEAALEAGVDADLLAALKQAAAEHEAIAGNLASVRSRLAEAVKSLAGLVGTPEHDLSMAEAIRLANRCGVLERAKEAAWQRVQSIDAAIFYPTRRPARNS